jgi:small GTP-binding protein
MRAIERDGALMRALDELDELAGGADHETLAGLRERLDAGRLRVLVVGEAKRGKSTLVNALLGRKILPTGVTPLTSVATTVMHGTSECLDARFLDGRSERLPADALEELVTERGNPANCRRVADVTIRLNVPMLARGVEIVDTPGTGSVHAHNTSTAADVLESMDAAVFVLTADPPVSASERDLLTRVAGLSVTMFVVLNKADYLDTADLDEALEFTAAVTRGATGQSARIYPLSARTALAAGGDPGFEEFRSDFCGYLKHGRPDDVRLAVTAHLRRLTGALLDAAVLERRAAQMRSGQAVERIVEFQDRLAAVRARGKDAADLASAATARMLAELNQAADCEARRLTAELGTRIGGLLAGELSAASPAEIERRGRERLARLTEDAVETWRQAQRDRLEKGLDELDIRLTGELKAELDAVRGAAAELLGIDLAVPLPGQRLVTDLRFFYTTRENVGQTELLAGAVRRRLPGEIGRRRAREHLRSEAAGLAGSQTGRARADLQYRLAEATRGLIRAVQGRYAESTDRLTSALQSAAAYRAGTAAEAERGDSDLARRECALRGVLARLGNGDNTWQAGQTSAGEGR